LKKNVSSYSFTDEETKKAMKKIKKKSGYIADPHGAVGYLGLKKYLKKHKAQGIFLETAHPVKFLDVVEPVLNETIAFPPQILNVINKKKKSIQISKYDELKDFLLKS